MDSQAGTGSRERIVAAATRMAQAHGYGGLNLRALGDEVGIKASSLYHHFRSKADLAAAVARRYWQDAVSALEAMSTDIADPAERLRRFPGTFRASLENENRLCLCSFMTAEYDDLPEVVRSEVRTFADANIAWLARTLVEALMVDEPAAGRKRAHAIFAAVVGAQLQARGRADIGLYDAMIDDYRAAGLLPA